MDAAKALLRRPRSLQGVAAARLWDAADAAPCRAGREAEKEPPGEQRRRDRSAGWKPAICRPVTSGCARSRESQPDPALGPAPPLPAQRRPWRAELRESWLQHRSKVASLAWEARARGSEAQAPLGAGPPALPRKLPEPSPQVVRQYGPRPGRAAEGVAAGPLPCAPRPGSHPGIASSGAFRRGFRQASSPELAPEEQPRRRLARPPGLVLPRASPPRARASRETAAPAAELPELSLRPAAPRPAPRRPSGSARAPYWQHPLRGRSSATSCP